MSHTVCVYCNSKNIETAYKRSDDKMVLRCHDCGLLFLDFPYENISELYQNNYYNQTKDSPDGLGHSVSIGYHGYAERGIYEFRWQQAVTRLFALYPFHAAQARTKGRKRSSLRLLDVGCSDGSFLSFSRDDGLDVTGIELVESAAARAKSRGFAVQSLSLEQFKSNQKFDVLTAWDVIEHLPDLRAAFAKIDSLLKDDGVFLFSTPDAGAPEVVADGDSWIGYRISHEHLSFLTEPFLRKSLTAAFGCEPAMVSFVIPSYDENTYSTLLGVIRKGGLRAEDQTLMDSIRQGTLVDHERNRLEQLWLYAQFQQLDVDSLSKEPISSPVERATLLGWAYHLANDSERAIEHLEFVKQERPELWPLIAFERKRQYVAEQAESKVLTQQIQELQKNRVVLESRLRQQHEAILYHEAHSNTMMQSVTWKLGRAVTSKVEQIPFSHQALEAMQVVRNLSHRALETVEIARNDGLRGVLSATLQHAETAIHASLPSLKVLPYLSPKTFSRFQDAPMVFVFLPSVIWHLTLFQRPQHLARALAHMGYPVIYDETGEQGLSSYAYVADDAAGFHELEPNVFLYRGDQKLLTEVPNAVLWTFTYNHHMRIHYPDGTRVIYDWIDDLAVFPHDQAFLAANHSQAVQTADVVFSVANILHEQAQASRSDAIYLPNGVEFDRFNLPDDAPLPDDQKFRAIVEMGKPIAGYYGALANWFDYQLLAQVAVRRPNWNFVLIGVPFDDSFERSKLRRLRNVFYLGPKPYEELPLYLHRFSVAMIPFLINDITLATSPLKLYEYFAGGKPTVTTAMPECMAYDEVLIAHHAAEFCAHLDTAREQGQNGDFRSRVRQLALGNTWKERAAQVITAIQTIPTKNPDLEHNEPKLELREQILQSLYSGIKFLERKLPEQRKQA
ncbi:MAG TPA: methyltransferase domain-containing protein [Pseudomonadota bacterium]|nr:methyltransferase domain-containing protein [Pseudomonadota bacterium]